MPFFKNCRNFLHIFQKSKKGLKSWPFFVISLILILVQYFTVMKLLRFYLHF